MVDDRDKGEETGASPAEQGSGPAVRQIVITTGTLWRAVGIVLLVLAAVWAVDQARDLAMMLVISVFFALAIVPAVNYLHARRGWRRGAAVGVIYLTGMAALLVLVVLLIPAIARIGDQIATDGTRWMSELDVWTADRLGFHIVGARAYKDGVVTVGEFLDQWSDKLLPVAGEAVSTGARLVFNVATIALFTFYLAAEFPKLQRMFLSWFRPAVQERLAWTIDESITQVGGYLYSRLLLAIVNGLGFFAAMVAVGVPTGMALALAVFGGFVSEFIPSIGTYIGAAIPVLLTLAVSGLVPALVVVGYAVVYQQIENYWLSPKLSEKTMELNGGLAFGAALAGGALFGPMGAFMALPVAALIVAAVHNYRHPHELVYTSGYGDVLPDEPSQASGPAGESLSDGDGR